jgi:hypothetical protein
MKTDAKLSHELIDLCREDGRDPKQTVDLLLGAAATVALVASSSKRRDFEELAGETFVHFAKANSDVRGRG